MCPDGIMWRVFLLEPKPIYILISHCSIDSRRLLKILEFQSILFSSTISTTAVCDFTYRRHNHLSLETSSDTVINTLRLSPARVDTFVGIALMSVETLGAYNKNCQSTIFRIQVQSSSFAESNDVSNPFSDQQCYGNRISNIEGSKHTLLDDRNVLLSGNHLYESQNYEDQGVYMSP